MTHIFISYKHDDEAFIDLLEQNLADGGITTWTDKELLAGDDWRQGIDEAIRAAFALIVVMSPEARASEYVTYEWSFALGCGVKVIPIMLHPTALHPRLEDLQYLDFTEEANQPWKKLIKRAVQLEEFGLIDALGGRYWDDRLRAARRLGTIKASKKAVDALARVCQRDRSEKVQVAAAQALENIGSKAARQALQDLGLSQP